MASTKFVPGAYHSEAVATSRKLNDVTLMLLGKTGAGKSSVGNAILSLSASEGFKVTGGAKATPIYKAVVKQATVDLRKMTVVDTPGVMDTNFEKPGNEETVLAGICSGIVCCTQGVDAFLIVIRQDVRFTEEEFGAICKLEQLFGAEFWRYVILVVTHGDNIDNDPNNFDEFLLEAQIELPTFSQVLSKLKPRKPLLVDAGRRRDPGVCSTQMNSLRFAVDELVQANKSKYTNELFQLAKAELTTMRYSELEEQQWNAEQEKQLLKQELDQLEEEKRELAARLENERDATETLRELYYGQQQAMQKKVEELKRSLQDAEKRSKKKDELNKLLSEAKKKLEDELKKKKCTIL